MDHRLVDYDDWCAAHQLASACRPAAPALLGVRVMSAAVSPVSQPNSTHSRFRSAITLGAGLRQGEAFGLTMDWVDFLRRVIVVDRQLVTPKSGAPLLGPPKRPASVRTIPVGQIVTHVLAAHLAHHEPGEHGVILSHEDGRPVTRNRVADIVRATVKQAGVERARFHDLRHFCASALIRKGLSVKAVQTRLGHASAVETLDVYGHLWHDDEDRPRDAVDELLESELATDTAT